MHTSIREALDKEYDLGVPECRHIKRDLKFHRDQCEILVNLARQREAKKTSEGWTVKSWNAWTRTALEAFENWDRPTHKLFGQIERADVLREELSTLQNLLYKWAEAQPVLQKVRSKLPSVPEEIGARAPVMTPTPALAVPASTGARSREPPLKQLRIQPGTFPVSLTLTMRGGKVGRAHLWRQ